MQCEDVDEAASATAKLIYVKGGNSYLCSGVLVADRNTANTIPYLLTAAHCISSETVANSLITFWDFEKATCDGPNPTEVTQHTGGATLLATERSSDHTLLRLNSPPPGDRYYMGWDSETVDVEEPFDIYNVHHPRGDLKRYSAGSAEDLRSPIVGGLNRVHTIYATLGDSATEDGSSGSGLFTTDDKLIGVLTGGPRLPTCNNKSYYGRFDLFFDNAKPWLDDPWPPPDPTSVALSSTTNASLTADERDWFKVVVREPGEGEVDHGELVFHTTGSTDTYGRLLTAEGELLFESDGGAAGDNFEVAYTVPAGTYYVGVRGAESTTAGDYHHACRLHA